VNVPGETVIDQCIQQLIEYFEGKRKNFDLNLQLSGTDFQKRVWKELLNIPYGGTISYRQLAERTGDVKNIRASASANGKNNFVIVIPCHRVTGSSGKLTGYSGGLWRKEWLLEHEKKFSGAEYQTRLF
jgi:methylated-DNA-[protein]-cysteine S-methyltransferase